MITYKQLSLADIFSDCQNKFVNDKYEFLSILDEAINLDEIVPPSFVYHFCAATGRPRKHLLINPKTFLGDAAFDSVGIYKYLLQETSFEKACIPLKNKLKMEGIDYTINDKGISCYPHDPSLPMKCEGSRFHLRCGLSTMKFVCPKIKFISTSISVT